MTGERKKLEEKVVAYRVYEGMLGALLEKKKALASKLSELERVKESLGEVKIGAEVLLPLGGDVFSFAKSTEEDSFLVNVGAGIFVKKGKEETREYLDERKEELERLMEEIEAQISRVSSALSKLATEIQEAAREVGG